MIQENLRQIFSSKSYIYQEKGTQQWPTFSLSSTPRASSSLFKASSLQGFFPPHSAFLATDGSASAAVEPSIKAYGDVRCVIQTYDVSASGAHCFGIGCIGGENRPQWGKKVN